MGAACLNSWQVVGLDLITCSITGQISQPSVIGWLMLVVNLNIE
jgi:hypothetical protein